MSSLPRRSAARLDSIAELISAVDDYWFVVDAATDPLENILDTKNISVAFDEDVTSKNIFQPTNVIVSARKR